MSFSSAKCEVMHFSRKRKPCSHLDRTYSLAGQQLRSVPNIKDLGVTVPSLVTCHGQSLILLELRGPMKHSACVCNSRTISKLIQLL